MAKLKVTRADGSVNEYEITPVIEYAFELHAKMGFHKALIEQQKQSDVYWLCWEAIRRSGETVKPFGEAFLESIKGVEVLESDPLESNGTL
jgi:hypothetical protein